MDAGSVRDRVQGVIIGLAAGDRNGGPICMAVHIAGSLVTKHKFDIDHIANRYLEWWHEGAFDTGPVTEKVLNLVASGVPYQEAATRIDRTLKGMTAGCNPTHRNPPLAMASFITDEDLSCVAIQEASLTHKHILAGDVAAATVVLCRNLIRGVDWITGLQRASEGRASQTRQALQINSKGLPKTNGFAPDVLRAAIYFLNQSEDFAEALNRAIKFAGPDNYCPVLVGAIGGARWGATSIPQRATAHCNVLHRVQIVADSLSEQWD